MATGVSRPQAAPRREAGIAPHRPSGVMPVFRGSVSLPPPAKRPPPLQLARTSPNEDAEWDAALAAAKERAQREEEAREWEAAIARSKARIAAQEEREWARLRMRAMTQAAAPRSASVRIVSWP